MSPKGAEMTDFRKNWFLIVAIGLPLVLVGRGLLVAQIEGP